MVNRGKWELEKLMQIIEVEIEDRQPASGTLNVKGDLQCQGSMVVLMLHSHICLKGTIDISKCPIFFKPPELI